MGGSASRPTYHCVDRRPTRTTSAPSPTLRTSPTVCGCTAPGIVATEALGIGAVHDGEAEVLVDPGLGGGGVLGVDREPGSELEAGGLGDRAEAIAVGPGALGVDVVGGDGRDAAPVVDAGVEQHPEVVGEVGRRLEVDLRREDQAGEGDGLEVGVGGAGRGLVHGGAGLGQEVLDDHLLHVAPAGVAGGDGLERLDAVGPVLAEADEDPGGERNGELAGRLERGEPALGLLVGAAAVGVEVGVAATRASSPATATPPAGPASSSR